ncbi:hypothetical protein P4B35_10575 [Pontiellaceae bacterium B12227]|nr:hypothetical protein [Pontiellaceae bacterium B12227]
MKITSEAIGNFYPFAKQVYLHEMKWKDAIDHAEAAGWLNRSSAHNIVQNYRMMREGKGYNRTLNVEATLELIRLIGDDLGKEAFTLAISAARQHIVYYADQPNGRYQQTLSEKLTELESSYEIAQFGTDYPDEISGQSRLFEGAKKAVVVNSYERNPTARRKCIEHYGRVCTVCDFRFFAKYGKLGEKFIHVHHEKDLAEVGEEYGVDPINDLKPVCPNCHAMLHQKRPAYTIEELKEIIASVAT